MKRHASLESAQPRVPGGLARGGVAGALQAARSHAEVSGIIGRLGAGVLPVVGVLMAPLVVTGYVGLTVLALPVLGLRSLLRARSP